MAGHQDKRPAESDQSLWTAAGAYTGYGLTWALSVLLFLLGGWWIDERLGTTPLMMIVGAFVGAGAGFYSLYRHVIAGSVSGGSEDPSTGGPVADGSATEKKQEGEEGGR